MKLGKNIIDPRVTIPDIRPSQVELWRGVIRLVQMSWHGNEDTSETNPSFFRKKPFKIIHFHCILIISKSFPVLKYYFVIVYNNLIN